MWKLALFLVACDCFTTNSPINPTENSCTPITPKPSEAHAKGLLDSEISLTNHSKDKRAKIKKPIKLKTMPQTPKKCKGRLRYLVVKTTVSKSKKPRVKRDRPNLDFPNWRLWCSTGISVTLKPFQWANAGK